MARDENTGMPPRGRRRSRDWSARQEAFGRREAELLHELAEMREKRISTLARGLVVGTIGEVQRLIEANPDSYRDPERPIG